MLADIPFASPTLVRSPVFTNVSVLMLVAGIGLSIFMFSSINALVLKPLTFPDPDRLVHFEYTDSHATARNLILRQGAILAALPRVAVVAIFACWLPGQRAAATNPMAALRDE